MNHRPANQTLTSTVRNMLGMKPSTHFIALIIGPPGSGKSVICKQLAYEFASEGDKVLYVSLERTAEELVSRMRKHGWDIQKYITAGNVRLADLYSWQIDGNQRYEETPYGSRLCPINLFDLNIGIQNTLEKIEGQGLRRVIADSLTTLTSLVGEENAIKAIRTIGSRIRVLGGGIATISSGVHSERFQNETNTIFDLVVEIKVTTEDKIQRYFRFTKNTEGSHPDDWVPFTISDQGIKIEMPLKPLAQTRSPV